MSLEMILAVIAFVLVVVGILTVLFKEGMVRVAPAEALVYKNIWSGSAHAIMPGTHILIPGVHEQMQTVTLKNEPSDPDITKVVSADPIELGIDYVVYTQRVGVSPEEVVKAVTKINYPDRKAAIIDRIEAEFQRAFGARKLQAFYDESTGLDRTRLNEIESEVNKALRVSVRDEWGIDVEIRLEDIDFPGKIQETAEEAATAEKEGDAIKRKADKAGVPSWLIVIGDALTETFGRRKASKKGDQS